MKIKSKTHLIISIFISSLFSSDTVSEEESKFIFDLQTFLTKKVIDIEMVANLLIEKDSSYTNQVPSRELEGVLKVVGVNLEKPLLDRMIKLAEVKKNHCSIQRIINLVKHGSNPVEDDGSKGNINHHI